MLDKMTTTKNCLYCDELISINAIKCKHCGSMLSVSPTPTGNLDPFTFTKMSLATHYEILSEIGRGGMASVYKAIQRNLQRTVALKVIHQNLIHDNEFIERFHSEARLAASLNHQNIIAIYDEGIENGVHFIAMEYLDGEDLHKKIQIKGKLSVEQTVQIISSIAESLDYIHKKGLIHRDIKTSNIIITNSQRAVLTDFGIARAVSGSKLSQTGSVLGTPEYMSPEQADGIGAEPRSDLYSLGVVMYECLAGVVPFSGENPIATIYKIINTPHPPLSKFNGSVPVWLQLVVNKSLSKIPQNRFSSGKEFSNALKDKKEIATVEKQFVPLRTQKLNIKDPIIEVFKKDKVKRESKRKVKREEYVVSRNKKPKAIYFIGATIIILLIAIGTMIFRENNFGKTNIEDLIKDAQYMSLSRSDQKMVLSLIESGDNLFNNNQLLQPAGENAFEMFSKVIKIHNTDSYARSKIESIFIKLRSQAKDDLNTGNNGKAEASIDLLKRYYPDRTSDLNKLLQKDENSQLLSKTQQMLSRNNLTLEDLNVIYANLKTEFSSERDNEIAKAYLLQLEDKFKQLGEASFSSNQFQKALQIYEKGREYFVSNSSFLNRINECRRKIQDMSLVEVPNLIGMTVEEASISLVNKGLVVTSLTVAGPLSERGLVVGQRPSAGTRVKHGDPVTLSVGE